MITHIYFDSRYFPSQNTIEFRFDVLCLRRFLVVSIRSSPIRITYNHSYNWSVFMLLYDIKCTRSITNEYYKHINKIWQQLTLWVFPILFISFSPPSIVVIVIICIRILLIFLIVWFVGSIGRVVRWFLRWCVSIKLQLLCLLLIFKFIP